MPSFMCQICYNDFDSANALRQHYEEFENQERELNQEYELCRKHDLSEPRSDGPNECPKNGCEQNIRDKSNLKRHFESLSIIHGPELHASFLMSSPHLHT
uniref:C2H2-type domain-containing protein n=1 Tax=Fusarium oxysporum (strain Fo5176) TaxID=660025 RepID=A0A0D2YCD2_FUSOF